MPSGFLPGSDSVGSGRSRGFNREGQGAGSESGLPVSRLSKTFVFRCVSVGRVLRSVRGQRVISGERGVSLALQRPPTLGIPNLDS